MNQGDGSSFLLDGGSVLCNEEHLAIQKLPMLSSATLYVSCIATTPPRGK